MPAVDWAKVNPGDTLWIQGGEYSGFSVPKEDSITIRAATTATRQAVFSGVAEIYDVDNSVIDGSIGTDKMFKFVGYRNIHTSTAFVLRLRYCQNTTLRGIEIDRSALYKLDEEEVHGIVLNNSSEPANDQIVIEDCHIHHLSGDGVNINTSGPGSGYDRYVVRRTRIHNLMDDGVQGSGGLSVMGCQIEMGNEYPKFGGHPDGVQTGIGCRDIRICDNFISGFTQNIFIEYAAAEVLLYNNVMVGNQITGSQRGMNISVKTNFSGVWLLANNTFYNFLTFYAIRDNGTLSGSSAQKIIGNNLFVNCKRIISNAATAQGFFNSNNIFWDEPGVQYYATDGSLNDIPEDRSAGQSRYVNPRLIEPRVGNFQLGTGSPAVDTGVNFHAFFNTDKAGVQRGATWDIGAFAFGSPPQPPKGFRLISE